MLITVKGVEIENKGKYQVATVSYMDKGKEASRKVVSFGDSADAYLELKNAKVGDVFKIDLKKDGKYLNWVGATRTTDSESSVDDSGGAQPRATYSGGWRPDPERESRDERQRKQVYIVRQSSLSAALEWFKLNPKIEDPTMEQVMDVAKQFEEFVFAKESSD